MDRVLTELKQYVTNKPNPEGLKKLDVGHLQWTGITTLKCLTESNILWSFFQILTRLVIQELESVLFCIYVKLWRLEQQYTLTGSLYYVRCLC